MPTVTRHPRGEGAGAARESGPPRHDPATPTRGLRSARWVAWYVARAPVFVSRVAAVLGLLTVTDALWPHRRLMNALGTFLPTPARATAEALVVVSGVLLLRVAAGLRRRKRGEWLIAVLICVVLTAANLVREDRRPVEAVVTVVLLAALLVARERFTAEPDPRSRWFAVRVSVQFLAVAVIYGMALIAMPGHLSGGVSLWARLREVVLSLVGLGGTIGLHSDHFADVFHASLLAFGLLTVTAGLVLALRPAEPAPRLTVEDEHRLRDLLSCHGRRDSLGYFSLRRDKSIVWSATGKAAIAY